MKAEIISVGTELLLGHTVNTDAAFIARELAALGIDLMNVETVGDNPGRLREVLETALSRSDPREPQPSKIPWAPRPGALWPRERKSSS